MDTKDPVESALDRYLSSLDEGVEITDELRAAALKAYYELAASLPDVVEDALSSGCLVDPKPFRNACGTLNHDELRKAELAYAKKLGKAFSAGDEAELGRLLFPMLDRYFKDHAEYLYEKYGVPDSLLGEDAE